MYLGTEQSAALTLSLLHYSGPYPTCRYRHTLHTLDSMHHNSHHRDSKDAPRKLQNQGKELL